MKRTNYSDQTVVKVIRDYLEGATAKSLEEKYGMTQRTIRTWLNEAGISIHFGERHNWKRIKEEVL